MSLAVILATGPSLHASDIELFISGDIRLYAVNDAYRLAPYADYLLAGDGVWWDHHYGRVKQHSYSDLWTTDRRAHQEYGINHFQLTRPFYSANSAIQAVCLATHIHHCRRVVLLGQDLHDHNGKHFFGSHPPPLDRPSRYGNFIDMFCRLKETEWEPMGVEIVNATPGSAMTCFPVMTPLEALEWLKTTPAKES